MAGKKFTENIQETQEKEILSYLITKNL